MSRSMTEISEISESEFKKLIPGLRLRSGVQVVRSVSSFLI